MKRALLLIATLAACRTRPPVVEMIHVQGGTFQLGAGPTAAGHKMALREFWIDQTEVTVAQYATCVKAGKCTEPANDWKTCNWAERESRGNHPVNCVNWQQASSYCLWAKKQLPSEEQWEFAARGTDGRLFVWKDETDVTGKICLKPGTDGGTCPVASYPLDRSLYGVMDLAANVKEWTSTDTITPDRKPARLIRGGSWSHTAEAPSPRVGVLERDFLTLEEYAADIGFRCSADVAP